MIRVVLFLRLIALTMTAYLNAGWIMSGNTRGCWRRRFRICRGSQSVESDFYRKVFLNKEPNYRREREMAAINAADVAKPDDIKADGASCLIKMTRPCFASFKQAFLDAGSPACA